MWPFQKPLSEINEADLTALIPEVREGATLDYKREMYGTSNGDTWELLKDVSGFANAHGGYIVIGMTEDASAPDGAPGELAGIDDGDQENDGSATDHVGHTGWGERRKE